jgi:hypothetical protein
VAILFSKDVAELLQTNRKVDFLGFSVVPVLDSGTVFRRKRPKVFSNSLNCDYLAVELAV